MPEPIAVETELENELNPAATPKEPAPVPPAASGTPKEKVAPDDPEFDLGVDEKGQPLKFKKSQILEFQKGNMLQADYTKKTQELAAQREQLKEMFNVIEHLKANPKKAERIIAILDEKEAQAEAKVDEIDQVLITLPEDDPYAKSLRALKEQTQTLLKQNQELQTKLGSFEQKTQTIEQKEAVKQAEGVLTSTLDEISKGFKFDDEDDAKDWKKMVLTYLVNNPKKYATEEEFKIEIKGVGQAEYDALVKRNERITGRYIKSKGGPATVPTHPAGAGAKPFKKIPSLGGKGTEDNLQEVLEEELKNESETNT